MPRGHSHSCEEHAHENPAEKGVQYSLYLKINLDEVTCLNESIDGSGKTVFKPWEERLTRYTVHPVVSYFKVIKGTVNFGSGISLSKVTSMLNFCSTYLLRAVLK